MRFKVMPEFFFLADLVNILPADFFLGNKLVSFKVRDNFLDRPLGDTNKQGDFPKNHAGVLGKGNQHMGVI